MVQSKRFALLFSVYMAVCAAVLGVRAFDQDNAEKVVEVRVEAEKVAMTTVVVAAKPFFYGMELSRAMLREAPWPEDVVPAGAFRKVTDLISGRGARSALGVISVNEPILPGRITGPGERATLAHMLRDNNRAITVRVNDVLGVAGFVLPGDRVDVLMTRRAGEEETRKTQYSTVLLQNVRVLGVDQAADDNRENPRPARTVTLEVPVRSAQKLALGAAVGELQLALRQPGEIRIANFDRVTESDLDSYDLFETRGRVAETAAAVAGRPPISRWTIGVMRALDRTEYNVPRDGEKAASATGVPVNVPARAPVEAPDAAGKPQAAKPT